MEVGPKTQQVKETLLEKIIEEEYGETIEQIMDAGGPIKANFPEKLEKGVSDSSETTPLKKTQESDLIETEQPTMRKSFGENNHCVDQGNKTQELIQQSNDKKPVAGLPPAEVMQVTLEPAAPEQEDEEFSRGHIGSFEDVLNQMREQGQEDIPVFLFQPNTNEMREDRMLLPPMEQDREYTLVLDLDETLIHFEEKPDGNSQFLIRPFAQYFLKQVSQYYEVVIFTAALQDYADYILDRMDTAKCIRHRLYRQHTNFDQNIYQKDLSRLGRDLSRMLIVDNNAENFQLQPDNGIYIKSWYDDPNDQALAQLCPLLIGKIFSFPFP
jgi:Dullard-like phosphatase family protein